jgi:oligopeptidase A
LFDQVKSEHVVPGVKTLLKEMHEQVDLLEAAIVPTWEGLVQSLEMITDRHERVWSVVSHLKVRLDFGRLLLLSEVP